LQQGGFKTKTARPENLRQPAEPAKTSPSPPDPASIPV